MALSLFLFIVGIVILPLIFLKFIDINLPKKRPETAFLIAGFFVLIGFVASFFIFYSDLSIGMVAFSSLLMLPFVIKISEYHKEKKSRKFNPNAVLKTHDKIVQFYVFLFFGMAISYIVLFSTLPDGMVNEAFSNQLSKFSPGKFTAPSYFEIILNNMQIVVLAFSLSIFFGAGSVFVLNYNASIIGAFYGFAIRAMLGNVPVTVNLISLIPHTFLEIMAYLLAAIAGGILAHGKKDYKEAAVLLGVSAFLILLAAFLEVKIAGSF